jgi:hypothetical protein
MGNVKKGNHCGSEEIITAGSHLRVTENINTPNTSIQDVAKLMYLGKVIIDPSYITNKLIKFD